MSQHDFDIANQTAPNVRADLNNALKALASVSSGSTAPTTTYANMIYYNTTDNKLWKRNEADSGWVSLGVVNETDGVFYPSSVTFATQAEAEAGTNSTRFMSPLRTAQAIAAQATGFGYGQTWTDVTASRSGATWYQNLTGKPIMISMRPSTTSDNFLRVGVSTVSYVTLDQRDGASGTWDAYVAVVPPNHYYYSVQGPAVWMELR